MTQSDKLLLVMAAVDKPCKIDEIKVRAFNAGFKIPDHWNPSAALRSVKGRAINTPNGWEITEKGKLHLKKLGVTKISAAAAQVATGLRAELIKIKNTDTRAFVEEAIKCFENELHRSAIVMSWLAAVDVLYKKVHSAHLDDFNDEAVRVDSKWKRAKSVDDLSKMKESDFLDRLVAMSFLAKNVKTELKNCLDRRNGCGHPNSLKIGPNTVTHHFEILLLNVFQPFA
jgi:hypothetical protein